MTHVQVSTQQVETPSGPRGLVTVTGSEGLMHVAVVDADEVRCTDCDGLLAAPGWPCDCEDG